MPRPSRWGFITARPGETTEVDFQIEFEIGPGSHSLEPVIQQVLGNVAAMQVSAFEDRCLVLAEQQRDGQPARGGGVDILGSHGNNLRDVYKGEEEPQPSRWPSPITGRILQR